MNELLLDFVSRWRWALLAAFLFTILTVFSGTPIIVAPLGGILLLFDAQRGGIRVLRCLPVRSAELGRFCWVCSVVLVPGLSAAAMLVLALIRELFVSTDAHLWFRIAVQVCVSFGYAAAAFILIIFIPTRPGETWRERLVGSTAGALWGLAIAGFIFIYPHLPRNPGQIVAWHLILLAVASILFIASLLLQGELVRRRLISVISSSPQGSEKPWQSGTSTLTGIPLFLATVPVRAVGITAMVYIFQIIFLSLFLRDKGGGIGALASTGAIQTGIMGIMFASFTVMWLGVRGLRVLPISSRVLAALLLSPALGVGILTAFFAALSMLASPGGPLQVQPWELGLLVFGLGAVGVALMIRNPRMGVFSLIALMSAVTPIIFVITSRAQSYSQAAPLVGAFFALTGYLLLVRMLRRTSAVYQAGAVFGMSPWSGQQQR